MRLRSPQGAKWLAGLIALGMLLYLPNILVVISVRFYEETFYRDVSDSLAQIAKDKPYCIIAPRIFETGVRPIREWVVLHNPEEISFHHVMDHAIRDKLFIYPSEDRWIKERSQLGREIHFGLLVQDGFYIWSFRKREFVEQPSGYNTSTLKGLRTRYVVLKTYSTIATLPEGIEIENYYCPLLYG